MADTETAVLELPSVDESALETETVDESINEGEPNSEDQETETLTREEAEKLAEDRATAAIAEKEAEWTAQRESETYKREIAASDQELQRALGSKVDGLIKWVGDQVENGRSVSEVLQARNPLVVQNIVEPLMAAAFSNQWEAQRTHFDAHVKGIAPEWKPSVELAKRMEQAVASRDPSRLIKAHYEYMADAIRSTEVPKGVAEALKAEKEKQKPGKAVAAEQKADAVRGSQKLPTSGTGGAVASPENLSNVIADQSKPVAERRSAFEKLHGFTPNF